MKCLILLLGFFVFSQNSFAQDNENVLSYEAFMTQVMEHHPYAFRAKIVESMGKSQLTQSRGAFDPKLFGNINQKYFDDKQYYSHIQGGVKIPTWFGISVDAGYSINDGTYLNPERQLPNSGLWYAGLRLELGSGLIIDQRRAEFERAKLFKNSSKLERKILLNELYRDASIAYHKWQQAHQELKIYELARDNASARLEATKVTVAFGDRPFIDTVEATVTLQNRVVKFVKAQTYFENTELNLELYLWSEGFIPLEIENTIPTIEILEFPKTSLESIDSVLINHPYLQLNEFHIAQKRIDLRLKKEQLKPRLTLKYNALNESINGNPTANYSPANYNWGATFSYPILSRKERGGVQLAKLKLEDQNLKNKVKAVEIENEIKTSFNNYLLAQKQVTTLKQLVYNNQIMYNAEQSLFNLGESSMFMINSRESTWLKSRVRLVAMEINCQILKAYLDYQMMNY